MTTELQVKTIELTPAVVKFNFDDLSAALNVHLERFNKLTFTDETAAECKKTIAELNKGKKALDTYRKDTKRELTLSVTAFEDQCKQLTARFDAVINPLKAQYDGFEDSRKDEKRALIEPIIKELIDKEGLNEVYAAELTIPDDYLTKSKSLKSIKAELATKAEHLGIKQDKYDADCNVILNQVELENIRHTATLTSAPYINLIGVKTIDEIKGLISMDAQVKTTKIFDAPVLNNSAELVVEKYHVTGTDAQLDALETYMSNQGLKWNVIES